MKLIRKAAGWTQKETAMLLGVSKKAIESYEQGWREPPDAIWKELITLLALQRDYPSGYLPCWKLMKCPDAANQDCFCKKRLRGFFCWMTATTNCHRTHPELAHAGIVGCLSCPVVRQFLQP